MCNENGEEQSMTYNFLKKAETYYLATVEDAQPRVRPFGTVNMFEKKFYTQIDKKKPASRQIAVNPKVEISSFTSTPVVIEF